MCRVENDSAQIVLGNHEFNAVSYATLNPEKFEFRRPHNEKNDGQHASFLAAGAEITFGSPLHTAVIDWFKTIPIWLDLREGLRRTLEYLREHAEIYWR